MARLPRKAPLTILLAEDHADSREMLAVMLEMDGYRVVRAEDGIEALDVNMPRMNGIDLIRAIRSAENGLSQTPIIAVTAYGSSFCLEAREAGANEAIAKPLGYEQVQEAVVQLLPIS